MSLLHTCRRRASICEASTVRLLRRLSGSVAPARNCANSHEATLCRSLGIIVQRPRKLFSSCLMNVRLYACCSCQQVTNIMCVRHETPTFIRGHSLSFVLRLHAHADICFRCFKINLGGANDALLVTLFWGPQRTTSRKLSYTCSVGVFIIWRAVFV